MAGIATFIFCLLLIGHVNSLYFLVKDTPVCYTFDQSRDTPVVFKYELLDTLKEVTFELFHGVSAAASEGVVLRKVLSGNSGHVEYASDMDGYYTYCLHKGNDVDATPVRVRMEVSYGFHTMHYKKLMKDHNFDVINLQVHEINDMLTLTLNEADYQKHKEVDYHLQTEKMNTAALWWPVVQIGILIMTGVFQVHYLKSFFKTNKLI